MSVYAVSDLHGYKKIWDAMNKELFRPDDTIYFLGDAIDRGPESYELLLSLLDDKRVIFLKGNHEEMFELGLRDVWETHRFTSNFNIHMKNGGFSVWEKWNQANCPIEVYLKLKALPQSAIYTNRSGMKILLSHSGCNPWVDKKDNYALLWDRTHIETEHWRRNYTADMIVHGHTPIYSLIGFFSPGAAWYCDRCKIDIDCGTYKTGYAIAFNLDTYNEYAFNTKL